jgi:hypothetical protein
MGSVFALAGMHMAFAVAAILLAAGLAIALRNQPAPAGMESSHPA